jgi:pimeloyl-ACP methyl ester carboxylesterase
MNKISLSLLVAATSCGLAAGAACSSSSSNGAQPSNDAGGSGDATAVDSGDAGGGNFQIEVTCTDDPSSIYGDPGTLPTTAGAIIKCGHYEDITQASLLAQAQTPDLDTDGGVSVPGYSGPAFISGAHVYRVLYRTERGDTNNTAGYSSALVFLPDTPRAPKSPVIVASHGSRGQGANCAPSTDNDAGAYVEGDFKRQVYPLVGAGYAVIAPDLAGYANFGAANNPPSAYADALDVGKSTLDGARALKLLIPSSLLDSVILVGHSQGGGTAVGALTLAATYAPELTIAGVAVYSPLWISARVNGAFLLEPTSYPLATTPEGPVIAWYLYTHGELLDGPGHGTDVFATADQTAIKNFVANDCWAATYPDLDALGTSINDLLDPAFVHAIANAAAGFPSTDTCTNSSNPTLCATWLQRFIDDWPHITGLAQSVPILSLYGLQDQTITPDLAACVFDRYAADNASYSVCVQPTAGHSSLVSMSADYVNQWIAWKTLGAAQPAACPADQSALVDDSGAPIPCNSLVPTN